MATLLASSCKKSKDDSSDTTAYNSTTSTALVTKFQLNPNSKVLINLDSVFFTIDTDKMLIYNVDSLPKGTDVSKMQVTLTFGSSVSSAMFYIPGKDDGIRYSASMKDSLDFSKGTVRLSVTSADRTLTRDYIVSLNVHQVNPDTVLWHKQAIGVLDKASSVTATQTTGRVIALATTDGGVKQLATGTLHDASWQVKDATISYAAARDLTSVDQTLYCIGLAHADDVTGAVLKSEDQGETWTDTGLSWSGILGAYTDRIIGVADGANLGEQYTTGTFYHVEYPARGDFEPLAVEDGFPISGCSGMVTLTNKWSTTPFALIAGGILPSGEYTGNTWAYDGNTWGLLSSGVGKPLPALRDVTVVPYYTATVNTVRYTAKYNEVLYAVGGRYADGAYNKKVYTSSDKGITWVEASGALQIPDAIAAKPVKGDAFVESYTISARSSNSARHAAPLTPITAWDCPCIYLVGCTSDGEPALLTGLYYRLSFRPVY